MCACHGVAWAVFVKGNAGSSTRPAQMRAERVSLPGENVLAVS
jgi:hypothetical protein